MKLKLKVMGLILPAVFLLDQLTKGLINHFIPLGAAIPIIPGLFDIVHTRNRGAAFGFMAHTPDSIRIPFFFVASFASLTLILIYFIKLKEERRSVYFCLAFILGGAFGNISDRIRLGEVIDFLSLHWYDKVLNWNFLGFRLYCRLEWPAFNVADIAISISVAWLAFAMISSPKEVKGQ